MTLYKHKFLLLGITLALLIGAGLAALNHYVREENKIHEAEMASAARVAPKPISPLPGQAAGALPAPTRSAPPRP